MDYTELTTNIEDITENTFTADQLAMFTRQTEQKIYEAIELPVLRRNQTSAFASGNPYVTPPADFLYAYSFAVVDAFGNYTYLLRKDVNFLREAYPSQASTGKPKYYSQFDVDSLFVGPTPDAAYEVQLNYKYRPESLVTAGTTWLGDNFDAALLNGALVEAIRFLKGEKDMVDLYDKMYKEALVTLKTLGEGKMTKDMYRSGIPRGQM